MDGSVEDATAAMDLYKLAAWASLRAFRRAGIVNSA